MSGAGWGNRFIRLDSLRHFNVDHPLKKGEYLTSYLELPVVADSYLVSFVVTDSTMQAGALARATSITFGPPGLLTISDLILGKQQSGLQWVRDGADVSLNPLNAFRRNETAEVFYLLTGLVLGRRYETRIDILRGDRKRLGLTFAEDAVHPETEVQRRVVLNNLSPGQYRMVVTVTDLVSRETAVREQSLNVVSR